MTDYFHLAPLPVLPGSIIQAGNWGRIIKRSEWVHQYAIREMVLEGWRLKNLPEMPSRLESAFVFLSTDAAVSYRTSIGGFANHILYRVRLADPGCPSHITDHRLCGPVAELRPDWASLYWARWESQPAAVPGIDLGSDEVRLQCREMLTLSNLIIEERLD